MTDRRPIASRNIPLWQFTANKLAAARISPNLISLLGMLAAFAAAAALFLTSHSPHTTLLYLLAAAGIQLRLLANMLDGMVALASGKSSPTGELFNEVPDRLSDTALLAAAGYSLHSDPALGWAAVATALFITYLRAFGKSLGVPALFQGPMAKSHRMFTLTLACLYLALTPTTRQPLLTLPYPPYPLGLIPLTLALITLLGLVTAYRRLKIIARTLKQNDNDSTT